MPIASFGTTASGRRGMCAGAGWLIWCWENPDRRPNARSGPLRVLLTVSSAASTSTRQPQTVCEPKVSVQRDDNRVTGIQILCSCGQVIELACVYEGPVPQAIAAPATAPQPATTPQPAPEKAKPGKICKDSGKDLPSSAAKKPKAPAKGGGTSAAKRRSA